jgi:hypothetical protein
MFGLLQCHLRHVNGSLMMHNHAVDELSVERL